MISIIARNKYLKVQQSKIVQSLRALKDRRSWYHLISYPKRMEDDWYEAWFIIFRNCVSFGKKANQWESTSRKKLNRFVYFISVRLAWITDVLVTSTWTGIIFIASICAIEILLFFIVMTTMSTYILFKCGGKENKTEILFCHAPLNRFYTKLNFMVFIFSFKIIANLFAIWERAFCLYLAYCPCSN